MNSTRKPAMAAIASTAPTTATVLIANAAKKTTTKIKTNTARHVIVTQKVHETSNAIPKVNVSVVRVSPAINATCATRTFTISARMDASHAVAVMLVR